MFGPFNSLESVPSRYQFVHVVARRARKLQNGARPLTPAMSRKPTRIAQQEAMNGVLDITYLDAEHPDAVVEGEAPAAE